MTTPGGPFASSFRCSYHGLIQGLLVLVVSELVKLAIAVAVVVLPLWGFRQHGHLLEHVQQGVRDVIPGLARP